MVSLAWLGLASGCHTGPNWSQRVGHYAFDDAVKEFGPPDRKESLTDGTLVADWMVSGRRIVSSPSIGGGYRRRFWGGGMDVYDTPEAHLILTFGPDKKLSVAREIFK